jgi:hypothetical protein
VRPAGRSSTAPSRSSATTGSFSEAARWQDGLRVEVTKTKTGKTGGAGPGARVGQPMAIFTLKLSNGSTRAIDVSQVVVGVRYGANAGQVATPIYDDAAVDFSGTLAPKQAKTARYAFELASSRNASIVMTVDVDAAHDVAMMRDRIQ